MSPPTHKLLDSLAPDQASLNAAKKLLAPKKWPLLEQDDAFLWGHCQGSGSTPYRVVYAVADQGYKCSCPSRKFPCKHVLALMWLKADQGGLFKEGAAPEWIAEWMARRRPKVEGAGDATAGSDPGASKGKGGSAASSAAIATEAKPKDPAAAERARVRNAKKREESIRGGLDELDAWLTDQLARGLIAFSSQATDACQTISRRLYDAKAPGLGLITAALGSDVYGWPEAERPDRLLAVFGQLHLVAEAYRRQDALSPALKADVRNAVGWTTTREALLKDPEVERLAGDWAVGAVRSETQVDRLRRHETWLVGISEENLDRRALLLDYVPAATGGSPSYTAGDVLKAQLAFYPSASPLRAQISSDEQTLVTVAPSASGLGHSLEAGLAQLDEERAQLPWRNMGSLWAHDLQVGFDEGGAAWIHDGSGERALPVAASDAPELLPLVGLPTWTGMVLWDGHVASLGLALTTMGPWRPA